MAYRNPILEFDVGQMNAENRRKAYGAHVISTTRSGTVGCIKGLQRKHTYR
jgi:hypothetical protein